MKVYIVTEGEYSDYHIVRVCSSQEEAERFVKILGGGEIETHEVDASYKNMYHFECKIYYDSKIGTQTSIKYKELWPYEKDLLNDSCKPYLIYYSFETDDLVFYGFGKTKEHALKSASDYKAKYLAEKAGVL